LNVFKFRSAYSTLSREAALRLFREHGYQATTMRAIAKEAGVRENLPAHRLDRADS